MDAVLDHQCTVEGIVISTDLSTDLFDQY